MKNKIKERNYFTTPEELPQVKPETDPKNDSITVVDKNDMKKMIDKKTTSSSTSSSNQGSPTTSTLEETPIDAVIEPQDSETIKYLSNVKDPKTNEISKPFTIGDKNYQMVRGMKPNREIVLGVLCLDEMGKNGHKIHGVEHFEKTIAIPMKERCGQMHTMDEKKEPNHDKEKFVDHLNLADVNGFKHFFVNTNTGDVTAKFKTTDEMLKSGVQLKPDERYVNAKGLKHLRYGHYFKPNMNEADGESAEGTDVNKLKMDVEKLTKLISNKFSTAVSKIDKPIEQVEFLSAMAEMIGVPFNKLTSLINSFRDIASQQKTTQPTPTPAMTENKVIKKESLLESLGVKQTITKIKDIK